MFWFKTVPNSLFLERIKVFTFIFLTVLLVVTPQLNLNDYPQPSIISKCVVFLYLCVGLFCLHTFKVLKSGRAQHSLSTTDIFLATLFIYIIVNRYFLQTDYSFSIRFIESIGLGLVYLIFRTLNSKTFYWLLLVVIVSGIIQAVYGNLQLLGYYPSNHSGFKLTGSFFNPGPYAGFLASVFPIALGLFFFKEKVINSLLLFGDSIKKNMIFNTITKLTFKYVPLLGIISFILVIPATQSRASWLAILISSLLLFEMRYQIAKKLFEQLSKFRKFILIGGVILIMGATLFGVYHFKKESSDGRLFIWKISTEIIKDNPVFGVGFDRFKAHYMNYQADYFSKYGETGEALVADNTYYAFNEIIQFITEQGVFGFVILLLMLYVNIKTPTRKENKELSIILKTSLLSIGIFAFFSYPMEILPIKLIVVVVLATLALVDQNKIRLLQNFEITSPLNIALKTSFVAGVLLISVVSIGYLNRLNTSFKTWKSAQNSYQYGDYQSTIQEFEKAYPILKNNGEFLMNYGKALSIYGKDKKAIQILERAKKHLNTTVIETALGDAYKNQKKYKEAEIAYTYAANMIPVRFYPLYLLAKLYEENGQKEKAVAMANTILNKDIKVHSTAINEIRQEMNDLKTRLKTK